MDSRSAAVPSCIAALRVLLASLTIAVAACSSTKAGGAPSASLAQGPVALDLPGLEGVDPQVAGELRAVEDLTAQQNYVAARSLLDRVLARPLDAKSRDVARRIGELLDLDPSLVPSLAMLEQAVRAGDDREARAILDRIAVRQPRGRVRELVEGYRRILDGRALVGGLRLALEFRPEALPSGAAGKAIAKEAPPNARFARLYFVARSEFSEKVELDPGPATLVVTRAVVGSNGLQQDATETRAVTSIRGLSVEKGSPAEVPLGYFYAVPPESGFATRLRFELELRSGDVRIPGAAKDAPRALPAMRLLVAPAEERALETTLDALGPAAPDDLAALVRDATSLDAIAALKVALRIPPEARAATLDALAPLVADAPIDVVRSLVPSLRWIALTGDPGSDPSAWRAWLRERATRKRVERPNLVLPESRPGSTEP
jgi:hypothetical protein